MNLKPGQTASKVKVGNPFSLPQGAGRDDAETAPAAPIPGMEYYGSEAMQFIAHDFVRDPFDVSGFEQMSAAGSPFEAPAGEAAAPSGRPADGLVLTLILMSDDGRMATINGEIYREGDEIQGEKIIEINRNGVVLQKGDVQRVLTLRSHSVTVTVEEKK